jgi:hypothetical protein
MKTTKKTLPRLGQKLRHLLKVAHHLHTLQQTLLLLLLLGEVLVQAQRCTIPLLHRSVLHLRAQKQLE